MSLARSVTKAPLYSRAYNKIDLYEGVTVVEVFYVSTFIVEELRFSELNFEVLPSLEVELPLLTNPPYNTHRLRDWV